MDTTIMIPKSSPGFTLVEIMIAMVISLILMAGVLTIMSSSKRTYALQSELAELQDNARFVMNNLTHDLRIAGYGGCSGGLSPFENNNVNDQIIKNDSAQNISGYEKSDKLIINFSELLDWNCPAGQQFSMGRGTDADQITLCADNSTLPETGDEIVITDCGCDIDQCKYTVGNVNGATVTNPNFSMTVTKTGAGAPGLHKDYERPIDVFFSYTSYYEVCQYDDGKGFALYKGTDTDPKNNTLCDESEENGINGKELVAEGVENMQVRYGIDNSGDNIPNSYSTTPTGGTVVSVRITLLMRTVDKRFDLQGATDKDFNLDPIDPNLAAYNPNDNELESGYRHRLFTSTISVRNSFF